MPRTVPLRAPSVALPHSGPCVMSWYTSQASAVPAQLPAPGSAMLSYHGGERSGLGARSCSARATQMRNGVPAIGCHAYLNWRCTVAKPANVASPRAVGVLTVSVASAVFPATREGYTRVANDGSISRSRMFTLSTPSASAGEGSAGCWWVANNE